MLQHSLNEQLSVCLSRLKFVSPKFISKM